jgi:GR25 family glycosyltransferase involved in LPS biosynthesis
METTYKIIEDACTKTSNTLKRYLIMDHSVNELRPKFSEIEKTIDFSKIGDPEFDKCLQSLNIQQISNFFKQKEALKQIKALSKENTTGEHMYMILEDDCIILPEFQKNLLTFLKDLKMDEWDILFLSSAMASNEYSIMNARPVFKVFPSKEAYCIKPDVIDGLLEYLDKIYYTYRIQLSRWIFINPDVRVCFPSTRISLEGSKIGFMTSTTTENNLLIYNHEFMELFKMMTGKIPMDLEKAKQIYKSIEHLKSPEIMHLFAVMLFKSEKKEEAKDLFIEAVDNMVAQNGCITERSELLNNSINIHSVVQPEVELYQKLTSKYENLVF